MTTKYCHITNVRVHNTYGRFSVFSPDSNHIAGILIACFRKNYLIIKSKSVIDTGSAY